MSSQSVVPDQQDDQPLDHYYRRFFEMEVPPGTSASRAWCGKIRPMDNDDAARKLLRYLDRDMQVDVDQGMLIPAGDDPDLPPHRLEPLLVSTGICFSLVVLDYGEKRHPEAYSVAPYIDPLTNPGQPHLRLDRVLAHAGRMIPALCVYSAAEFRYSAAVPRLAEFLDQTATYLAKHVIWLRTRRLYDAATGVLLYAPRPGEIIIDTETRDVTYVPGVCKKSLQSRRIWSGFWPGKTAAMGPADHTRIIKPQSLCWCGSGEQYGSCHRPTELAWLKNVNSKSGEGRCH